MRIFKWTLRHGATTYKWAQQNEKFQSVVLFVVDEENDCITYVQAKHADDNDESDEEVVEED